MLYKEAKVQSQSEGYVTLVELIVFIVLGGEPLGEFQVLLFQRAFHYAHGPYLASRLSLHLRVVLLPLSVCLLKLGRSCSLYNVSCRSLAG